MIFCFTVDTYVVRSYHECQSVWQVAVGEMLKCVREVENRSDVFSVAVIRAGETVRYPTYVSQARLTNPAFALCSCETEEEKYAR